MLPVNDIEKHCKWLSGTLFTLFIYITTILYKSYKLFFIICLEEKVTILEFLNLGNYIGSSNLERK